MPGWYGIRAGYRWSVTTCLVVALIALTTNFLVHDRPGFGYDWLIHIAPSVLVTLLVGVARAPTRESSQPPIPRNHGRDGGENSRGPRRHSRWVEYGLWIGADDAGYVRNDSPQPHSLTTLGFSTWKPAAWRPLS